MAFTRNRQLMAAWGLVGLVYSFSPLLAVNHVTLLPSMDLDHLIGWQPQWLIVYASFFVLIPWVFYRIPIVALKPLRLSMQVIAAVSAMFFILLPTTLTYPNSHIASAWSHTVWQSLHQLDHAQQCLPSLHASLSTVCSLAWGKFSSHRTQIGIALWYGLMIYSILACKRHFIIDVSAGMVLGYGAYRWVFLPQLSKEAS